ncbi:MAG: hypothetical protein A4E65_02703 [Syntrophorhabdus sp. PtaU1.Bin153]|nr:MAG: hypothetical protein A4E65_02703 [Syntrophorhabdus sp. PtaU1.Bin153]
MIIANKKGFTLIEIVVVIVVLSILAGFTFAFVEYAIRTYLIGNKQTTLHQEASYIMERITRELRDMGEPVTWTNGTTYDILQFSKRHGTPLDSYTDVTFFREASTGILYRRTGGVSRPIGQNITQFVVTKTSSSACDRSVTVQITLTDGDQAIVLGSTVAPKNLGSTNYIDRCFNGDYEDLIQ